MKVHFLTENALEALRTNLRGNLKHYADDTNDWIYDYFGADNPFIEYKQEFPDFQLTFNTSDDFGKIDVNNTITLYSAMRSLTDTQATDERLWSGMCHSDFWGFLNERWQVKSYHDIKDTNIMTRYFFAHNKKRSLVTNSLAKLWWIGRLTYDENRTDPFELTKYLATDYSTKSLVIFSNNYISNSTVAIGLFSALKHLEDDGYKIKGKTSREIYYEATKYLNVLGGTYILDYFTSEEIKEKVIKYMKSLKGATYNSSELKALSLV